MMKREELLRDQLDGFGKSLFDAGDHDAPKDGSAEKLLVALGIGAAITAASSTAAAATTTTAAASSSGIAATATKIAIIAAIATGGAAGAVAIDRVTEKPTPVIVAKPAATVAAPPVATATAMATTTSVASTTPDALPDAPAAKKAEAKAPTLSEQVELVDEARAQLAAGHPDAALATTRKFEQRLGAAAALHPEMMLVAVQAHLARGDAESARRVAGALSKQHPSSAAARRAAELTGSEK